VSVLFSLLQPVVFEKFIVVKNFVLIILYLECRLQKVFH